jgi:hypothetical protein
MASKGRRAGDGQAEAAAPARNLGVGLAGVVQAEAVEHDGRRAGRRACARLRSGGERRPAGRCPPNPRPAAAARVPGGARSPPLREREVRGDIALDVAHDAIGHGDSVPPTSGRANEATPSVLDGRPASLVRPAAPVGARHLAGSAGPTSQSAAPSARSTRRTRRRSRRADAPVARCHVAR